LTSISLTALDEARWECNIVGSGSAKDPRARHFRCFFIGVDGVLGLSEKCLIFGQSSIRHH
jgi:hypothetical protein